MTVITTILAVLLLGSLVYCILIMVASRRYLSVKPLAAGPTPPISLLKPLCGEDEGLDADRRSLLDEDDPVFAVLCAVDGADDSAVGVVEKLCSECAGRIEIRLVVPGESPVPNPKAHRLKQLLREARHELLVMRV